MQGLHASILARRGKVGGRGCEFKNVYAGLELKYNEGNSVGGGMHAMKEIQCGEVCMQ